MAEQGDARSDFFRLWLEGNRALLGAAAGPLWQQAEAIHAEWVRFAEAFAGAGAARRAEAGTGPFDPAGWLRPEGGGGMADLLRWLEGPEVGGPFAGTARALRGTREWLAYVTAAEQMKAVLAEGWIAAFRLFLDRFAAEDRAARAENRPAPGWERMQAIWHETAAERLAETYRSPACLAAQRDLVAAETALRRSMRAEIERVAEDLGLPTRAELDRLAEGLHGLSREMRRMRAEARRARGPGGG